MEGGRFWQFRNILCGEADAVVRRISNFNVKILNELGIGILYVLEP